MNPSQPQTEEKLTIQAPQSSPEQSSESPHSPAEVGEHAYSPPPNIRVNPFSPEQAHARALALASEMESPKVHYLCDVEVEEEEEDGRAGSPDASSRR